MVINPGFSPSSASRLFLSAFILRALANFDPPTIPEDNETLLVLYRFLSRALVTLLLQGNSRVGHLFSEKPCKCFSYCNTIKKYTSTIFLPPKSKFKVLNLPLTRSSAINVSILLITRRNVTRVEQQMISNMADCSSSSDSATSLSDYSDVEELLDIRDGL